MTSTPRRSNAFWRSTAARVARHLGFAALTSFWALGCGGAVFDPAQAGGAGGSSAGDNGAAGSTPGASGSTMTSSGGSNGGSGGNIGQGGDGAGGSDVPVSCPTNQPQNGSVCASAGQSCDYDPIASCPGCSCRYHCWNGSWVEDGSGCDPGPDMPPTMNGCPVARPKDGTYCAYAPASGCTYVAAFCGDVPNGWTTYNCVDKIWKAGVSMISPCMPTMPAPFSCPAAMPTAGAVCAPISRGDGGGTVYPPCLFACRDGGVSAYVCAGGRWSERVACGAASVEAGPLIDGGVDATPDVIDTF